MHFGHGSEFVLQFDFDFDFDFGSGSESPLIQRWRWKNQSSVRALCCETNSSQFLSFSPPSLYWEIGGCGLRIVLC